MSTPTLYRDLPDLARRLMDALLDAWMDGPARPMRRKIGRKRLKRAALELVEAGLLIVKYDAATEDYWLELTEDGQTASSGEVVSRLSDLYQRKRRGVT